MLLRIAALAALVFLAAPASPACACMCGHMTMNAITFAIRGEVTNIEITEVEPHVSRAVATVRVTEVLRGPAELETMRIAYQVGDGANCGVNFRRGYRGFISGTGNPGQYTTGLCSLMSETEFLRRRAGGIR
jgi:hypothetical protein